MFPPVHYIDRHPPKMAKVASSRTEMHIAAHRLENPLEEDNKRIRISLRALFSSLKARLEKTPPKTSSGAKKATKKSSALPTTIFGKATETFTERQAKSIILVLQHINVKASRKNLLRRMVKLEDVLTKDHKQIIAQLLRAHVEVTRTNSAASLQPENNTTIKNINSQGKERLDETCVICNETESA
jgi:hypothetical protein